MSMTASVRRTNRGPRGWIARTVVLLMGCLPAAGCGRGEAKVEHVAEPPEVRLMSPSRRTITRSVVQPSFIESFERTAIYPKVTGYIEKWHVDIGDHVTKGQVLADLFVPEIVEDYETKAAAMRLDRQRIQLAIEAVKVAVADVNAADARLDSARKILDRYEAQVDRWQAEVERLVEEAKTSVVDKQVLAESKNQWKSSKAARDAALADIMLADADLESKKATKEQRDVAVDVAKAALVVATSDWKRMGAWVGYLKLYAPFDGIITARNANQGDIVLPATGDPSSDQFEPHLSPGDKANPIFVVDRIDIVRVFADIQERDANYVRAGTRASIVARAYRDEPILGSVTRTSWALNMKSRTLRAEVDLPNPRSQLLPGMYADVKVIVDRPNVFVLPKGVIMHAGEKKYYWSYSDGKVVRTEVQTGSSDGTWIEIMNHRPYSDETASWVPVNGLEQIAVGDLHALVDGSPVRIVPELSQSSASERPRH